MRHPNIQSEVIADGALVVTDRAIGDELGDDGLHFAVGDGVYLEHGFDVLGKLYSPSRSGCLLRARENLALVPR